MNERIKELIIETIGKEGVIDSRAFGHWALSDEELEKFAKLIVQECARIADNQEDYLTAKIIKQHFGVKE